MAYVVLAKWTAKESEIEAVSEDIRRLIGPSRAEPGNLAYECLRDPQNQQVFLLYEAYVDENAYAAHGQSEHFRQHALGHAIPRLESRERSFYVTWDG